MYEITKDMKMSDSERQIREKCGCGGRIAWKEEGVEGNCIRCNMRWGTGKPSVSPRREFISPSSSKLKGCYLGEYGNISDSSGKSVGHVGKYGGISDSSGRHIGHIGEFDQITDRSGRHIGHVDKFGNIK